MPLAGPGGILAVEYRHPAADERHSIHLCVAHFDPTPVTTSYGANDRLYLTDGPVVPTSEASVLATFAAIANLWRPYYSSSWTLYLMELRQVVATDEVALSPLPTAFPVSGTNGADDDTGPRGTRRIRLLGHQGAVRHLWLSQVQNPSQPRAPLEVTPTSGGLDARDQAWMAYLSGATGGAAVMYDGTYAFPVTDMRVEWARALELVGTEGGMPGAPYLVSG